jgi:hypothetical protein
MMDLRRFAPVALLVPAAAAAATLGPRWPKDQRVRYELGEEADRVEEIDARWAPSASGGAERDDWAREATFRFGRGRAPRVVSHEPRLADGDYVVEIEIQAGGKTAIVHRNVTLEGGTTTLDLAGVVP